MNSSSTPYKYFAFISYSRKDSKAAAWLQKRLEWFCFPVKLVPEERRPPNPKYVRPVYRDKTNLEVTDEHYWPNIRRALEESRYLIVLCSPNAAKSEPVNMEVTYFLEKHGGDSSLVAPVIVSGNVSSDGEDAALCPALRAVRDPRGEPLINRNLPTMVPDAVTTEQDAWEAGFVALVSYLLRLERGAIGDHIQRETRRQARVLRRWLGAVGLLAVLALLATWFAVEKKKFADAQLVAASRANHAVAERLLREAVSTNNPEKTGAALAHLEQAIAFDPTNEAAIQHTASVLMHRELPRHPIAVWQDTSYASYSHNGARIIVQPNGRPAWVHDVETGTSLGELPGEGEVDGWLAHTDTTLRVSRDKRHTLALWTPGAEPPMVTVTDRWNGFYESSPDGTLLAVARTDPHEVVIWSVSEQRLVGEPMPVPRPVKGLAFDPTGTVLAVNLKIDKDHFEVARFDLKTRQAIGETWPLPPKAFSMEWKSSKLITGSDLDRCHLLDPATGRALRAEPIHSGTSDADSHDGRSLAFGEDGVQVLDYATGRLRQAEKPEDATGGLSFGSSGSKVWDLTFSPDDQFLVGALSEIDPAALMQQRQNKSTHSLRMWDAHTLQLVGEKRMLGAESDFAFTPDGRWIIVQSGKNELTIRDTKSWQAMGGVLTAPGDIFTFKASQDGRTLLVTTRRGSVISDVTDVQLWPLADAASPGEPVQPPEAEAQMKLVAAWRHLPVKDDDSTRIAAVADMGASGGPEVVGRSGDHPADLEDLGSGPYLDGAVQSAARQIVTITTTGELRVWNYETQKLVFGPVKHEDIDDAGPPSADGRFVAFCYPDPQTKTHVTEVWDMIRNLKVAEWRPAENAKWKAAFDASGRRVLLYPATNWLGGMSAETVVLDLQANGRMLMRLRPISPDGSQPDVVMASWRTDQRTIVLACKDMTVRLFDAATGVPVSEPIAAWSIEPRYELSADERWLTTFRPIGGHRVELPTVRTPPPPGLLACISVQRVADNGILRRMTMPEWIQTRQTLREHLKTMPTEDPWRRIAEWTLAHSWSRAVSPHHALLISPWLAGYIPGLKGGDQEGRLDSVLQTYAASLPPEMVAQMNNPAMREMMTKVIGANQQDSAPGGALSMRRLDPGHPLFALVDAINATAPATQAHLLRLAAERFTRTDRETAAMGATLMTELQEVADPATALRMAEAMLAAQPGEPNALHLHGIALLALDRPKDALRSLTALRTAQSAPTAQVMAPLSALLWLAGDKARSIAALRSIFDDDIAAAVPGALLYELGGHAPDKAKQALMLARAAALTQGPSYKKDAEEAGISLQTTAEEAAALAHALRGRQSDDLGDALKVYSGLVDSAPGWLSKHAWAFLATDRTTLLEALELRSGFDELRALYQKENATPAQLLFGDNLEWRASTDAQALHRAIRVLEEGGTDVVRHFMTSLQKDDPFWTQPEAIHLLNDVLDTDTPPSAQLTRQFARLGELAPPMKANDDEEQFAWQTSQLHLVTLLQSGDHPAQAKEFAIRFLQEYPAWASKAMLKATLEDLPADPVKALEELFAEAIPAALNGIWPDQFADDDEALVKFISQLWASKLHTAAVRQYTKLMTTTPRWRDPETISKLDWSFEVRAQAEAVRAAATSQ